MSDLTESMVSSSSDSGAGVLLSVQAATFNRRKILLRFRDSFFESCLPRWAEMDLNDDSSSEFAISDLREWFGSCASVHRNEKNVGPDANMLVCLKRGLESGAPYTMLLDSDLLISPQLWDVAKKCIDLQMPFVSFYNSTAHPQTDEETIEGLQFVIKPTVGAAGCMFERKVLAEIVEKVPLTSAFDWDWSRFLHSNGIPLRVTECSYVQHLGVEGTHTTHGHPVDFGRNFQYGTVANLEAFADVLVQVVDHQRTSIETVRDLPSHRFGRLVCYPFFSVARWLATKS